MGLFNDLFSKDKKKSGQAAGLLSFMDQEQNDNKSEYSKDELDAFCLEDWERELVERGENDPWNFDESELEDDDYYTEDD